MVPWLEVFQTLKRINYQGCVTIESFDHRSESYTFAAGRNVWVDGNGNFVWADSSPFSFGQGTYHNRFLARSTGGVHPSDEEHTGEALCI